MNTTARYLIIAFVLIVALHSILSFSHEGYGRATSISGIANSLKFGGGGSQQSQPPPLVAPPATDSEKTSSKPTEILTRRANATLVVLARNKDVGGVVSSMKEMENSFNKEFRYPWVFLNDEPFSDEFKKRTSELTDSVVEYGLIPKEHWVQPEWIDEEKATAGRDKLTKEGVIYADSVSYRNMCRFNSGFFYRHELLQKYKWYWRVEPDVHFYCDLHYDPFLFMEDNKKVYGFTISLYEFRSTIETLWGDVKEFMKENPQYVANNNAMKFLSDDGGDSYNLCHFWSNFEIADMDFWRSEAYSKFFEFLEAKGGFYYERWGDAPVHSIAASLFAPKDQIHFFSDIGYRHGPYQHCPQGEFHKRGKCWCDANDNFDYDGYSCMSRWDSLWR